MTSLIEIYSKINELIELKYKIEYWKYNHNEVTVYAKYESMYFYGHSKRIAYNVYIVPDDVVDLVLEYINYVLFEQKELKIPNAERIVKLMLQASKLLDEFDVLEVERVDSEHESRGVYIYVYKVPPRTVPIIKHIYTPYSHKYSTYLSPREDVFIPELQNPLYLDVERHEVKQFEIPERYKELFKNLNIAEKIRQLLKQGYRIIESDEVVLEIGSSNTSKAWWDGRYEVLAGEVEEKVIRVSKQEFPAGTGWVRETVKIVPKTDVAVIKYTSQGYPIRGWNQKTIYILKK